MGNPFFEFKEFTIYHDKCAMKVGTDGVLLGAWAQVGEAQRILDIGTGSGLIALMMAQRTHACVTGLDIDADAVFQAIENANHSPWPQSITILEADIKNYNPAILFDAIVCNPPFFNDALKSPDLRRTTARHTSSLSFLELIVNASRLLLDGGTFHVVLPFECADHFITNCWTNDLVLQRKCSIYTKAGKSAKRVLLHFKKGVCPYCWKEESLFIKDEKNNYTDAYRLLTRDFYL